jgi:hypothetical protein
MFDKSKNLACRLVLGLALVAATSAFVGLGAQAAVRRIHRGGAAHSIEKTHFTPKFSREALIVGNGRYPDADAPLVQPSDDVRALAPVLQEAGFSVVALEDARERDLRAAIATIKTRMKKDATYASRRNPFERRFRAFSHGLAPVVAPVNSLVLVSEPFDWTTDDSQALRGLGRQMVVSLGAAPGSAEEVFRKIRSDLARSSASSRVPTITSSLIEEVVLPMIPSRELLVQLGQ